MIGDNFSEGGSVVDPKLFMSDPDLTLTLISDPDSDPD